MRLSYRLTIDDYYDAGQARNRQRRLISNIAVLAMAVLISVALIRDPNMQGGHKYLSLGLFLIVFFGLFVAFRWVEKLLFRSASKKTGGNSTREYTVDISENGIHLLDPPQQDDWSHFSKYSESTSSFILYQGNTIHAILPKRAFDPEGIDSFRQILSGKLPKH